MVLFSIVLSSILIPTLSSARPWPQNEPVSVSSTGTTSPKSCDLPTGAMNGSLIASSQITQLAQSALQKAKDALESNARKGFSCNSTNVVIRQEWGDLSLEQRKAYTDAVVCLQRKEATTPKELIPGARSRFDDFVGAHMNQTTTIHWTGTFLTWHRYYTWQYERALREECGYTGYQPYWDWTKTAATGLENSPIFDGSEYSMSGNGEYQGVRPNINIGGLELPAGSGGGCVTSGPFKDMQVNLGPVSTIMPGNVTLSNGNGLTYNPRCLRRDLTNYINQKYVDSTAVAKLILNQQAVEGFQLEMQGKRGSGILGVHGGGHFSFGGDPGRDTYTSPGDPMFHLHHAMVDRVWWIWQQIDVQTRTGALGVAGTMTNFNIPPSANVTLDTDIDLGFAAGPVEKVGNLMSTIDGPMCYVYM